MKKKYLPYLAILLLLPAMLGITGSTFTAFQITDFNSGNSQSVWLGVQAPATLNSTTNVDLLVSDDAYVIGGLLLVNGASWGDFIDLKVVDKDGCIFSAGTVVKTVVTNFYVSTDRQLQSQFTFQVPGAKILGCLYLRIVYHSTSAVGSPAVAMNYFFQKVLY